MIKKLTKYTYIKLFVAILFLVALMYTSRFLVLVPIVFITFVFASSLAVGLLFFSAINLILFLYFWKTKSINKQKALSGFKKYLIYSLGLWILSKIFILFYFKNMSKHLNIEDLGIFTQKVEYFFLNMNGEMIRYIFSFIVVLALFIRMVLNFKKEEKKLEQRKGGD